MKGHCSSSSSRRRASKEAQRERSSPSSRSAQITSCGSARSLSPGERSRATLALQAARGVNALVLDEPTNHLDLEAIVELESALEHFEGTVVLVTHDRRFLDAFRATRTLDLGSGFSLTPV